MDLAPPADPAPAPAKSDPMRERSGRIVDAAYALLEEEGLEGLTIRAMLRKTGLSRRAFYERFAGKDDLMLAVFEHTIRLATLHYEERFGSMPDPLERLELIVSDIGLSADALQGADSEKSRRRGTAMTREHLRLAESRPQDLHSALSPLIGLIARQLSDGMAAGLVRKCAPASLATLVYNLVSTTVHMEFLAEETAQSDRSRRAELAADLWEFCRRAIAA